MASASPYDLVVIGGGINGVGIARDAAGRGLTVLLCEKDDLAQGTSSRSGKLIHGGLRYLEYYEFRLVREALIEREVLLRAAPHIVWPMRFVLPHSPEQRPAWLVRLGLFLYDHLGGRKMLPPCRTLKLARTPEGEPIKSAFHLAFEYSDCWVDDARLVVLNALDAKARGAEIQTRTEALSARRSGSLWQVDLARRGEASRRVECKVLVNAAGPWVEDVVNRVAGLNAVRKVRLVKGSHIIVRKFWQGPQAYLFQHHDKRVIFVNPYQRDLALIGTTDIPYDGRAEDVAIDAAEKRYLLDAVNRYLKVELKESDILHDYAGVRPLYDDNADNPSAVTRDYVFEVEGTPPLLSVFGGKITTYRKLAEHALQRLQSFLPAMQGDWTARASLPGGEIANAEFEPFLTEFKRRFSWLPAPMALRLARLYGTRADAVLGEASDLSSLGQDFGGSLYAAEIDYLLKSEWAETADDVLDRRTKLGLVLTEAQRGAVSAYISQAHR
jgi:glycerol-3-phosphate dehydrogenase